jgi:hypothetical protein
MEPIFNEIVYNNLIAVGFSEEEAQEMATQPEEANLSETPFTDKRDAVWGFAKWDLTKEGLDYWLDKKSTLE